MQLIRVEVENFACFKHGTWNIEKIQAIAGENGTGKSTVLKAIVMGITGGIFNPLTGKLDDPLGFFGFADDSFTVRLSFKEPDLVISRTFHRKEVKGTMKVTQEATLYPIPTDLSHKTELNVTDVNNHLRILFGSIHLFSFEKFFQESPAKQFEVLANFLNIRFTPDDFEKGMKEAVSALGYEAGCDKWMEGLIVKELVDLPLVNNALASANRKTKDLRQKVDTMKKTVRSLVEIKADFNKTAEGIQELEEGQQHLQDEYDKNRLELDNHMGNREAREKAHADHIYWKERLVVLEDTLKTIEEADHGVTQEEIEKGLQEAHEKLKGAAAGKSELETKYTEVSREVIELSKKSEHQLFYEGAESILAVFRELADEEGACPVCAKKITNEKVVEKSLAPPKDYVSDEEMTKQLTAKKAELERVRKELSEVTEEVIKEDAAIKQHEMTLRSIEKEMEGRQARIEEKNKEIADTTLKLSGAMAAMEETKDVLNFDVIAVDNLLESLSIQLVDVQTKLKNAYEFNGVLKAQESAAKQFLELKEGYEIAQAIEKTIKIIKARLVEDSFAPLYKKIGDIFMELDRRDSNWLPLVKFKDDRGNDAFRLGLTSVNPTTPLEEFVPYSNVNTSHQTKLLVSLLLALPRGKYTLILLDDMEKLSVENEEDFLSGLLKLEPEFDNFIFATSRGYTAVETGQISCLSLN